MTIANQRLDRLNALAPFLREPARELITRCERQLKRVLLVVWTWRSLPDQMRIYQEGRTFDREAGVWTITDPSAVKTKAKPGTTPHNIITRTSGDPAALALDVVPFDEFGKLDWDVDMRFWDSLYEIAWKCGLDPLGDQIGAMLKGDLGHFEEPAWRMKLDGLGLLLPVDVTTI
jgi:hypothetical protein